MFFVVLDVCCGGLHRAVASRFSEVHRRVGSSVHLLAVGRYDLRMVVAAMECTLTECPNAIHGRASVSTGDPSGSMSHPILLSGGAVHPRLLRGDAFSVITDKWFIRVGNFNDIKL